MLTPLDGWLEGVRGSSITVRTAGLCRVRMIRHNGEHGRLEVSEEDADITVSTAGWRGVRVIWHKDQHRGLVESEDGPA